MDRIEIFFAVITSVLTAVILAVGTYSVSKIKGFAKKQTAIEKGVQALLRDRVIQMFNHYTGKGHIPIYARENVESLKREYHALGGNGVVEGLVKRLMELPVDNANDADREDRSSID